MPDDHRIARSNASAVRHVVCSTRVPLDYPNGPEIRSSMLYRFRDGKTDPRVLPEPRALILVPPSTERASLEPAKRGQKVHPNKTTVLEGRCSKDAGEASSM